MPELRHCLTPRGSRRRLCTEQRPGAADFEPLTFFQSLLKKLAGRRPHRAEREREQGTQARRDALASEHLAMAETLGPLFVELDRALAADSNDRALAFAEQSMCAGLSSLTTGQFRAKRKCSLKRPCDVWSTDEKELVCASIGWEQKGN